MPAGRLRIQTGPWYGVGVSLKSFPETADPKGPDPSAMLGWAVDERSEAERKRLLEEAYGNAEPLGGKRRLAQPVRPSQPPANRGPASKSSRRSGTGLSHDPVSVPAGYGFTLEHHGEHWVEAFRTDLGRGPLRELKGGAVPPEATLDLHGFDQERAIDALCDFLGAAAHERRKVVRVVHGKGHGSNDGKGVLHSLTLHILQEVMGSRVAAFCTAVPRLGGGGALLVRMQLPKRSSTGG